MLIRCRFCDDTWDRCHNRYRDLSLPRVWHSFYVNDVTMDELVAVNSKPPVKRSLLTRLKDEWSLLCQQRISVEFSVVVACVVLVLGMVTWYYIVNTHDYMRLATFVLFGISTAWVSNANENEV